MAAQFRENNRDIRFTNVGRKFFLDDRRHLRRRVAARQHIADQWHGNLPIRTHWHCERKLGIAPDRDLQTIVNADAVIALDLRGEPVGCFASLDRLRHGRTPRNQQHSRQQNKHRTKQIHCYLLITSETRQTARP